MNQQNSPRTLTKLEPERMIMPKIDDTEMFHSVEGYEPLARVLKAAYEQSAGGKGKERHAGDRAFLDQPIIVIPKTLNGIAGLGGVAYQVNKKVTEATNMADRGNHAAAKKEFLGAIVYAAACYLYTEHLEDKAVPNG